MRNELTQPQIKRFQFLLMKTIDNKISMNERCEFDRFIDTFSECKIEWHQFKELKEVIQDMKFKTPPEEVWDSYWVSVYNLLARGITGTLF